MSSSPFDKFMDDILLKEAEAEKARKQAEETPQREYVRRYSESAANRIKFGSKK